MAVWKYRHWHPHIIICIEIGIVRLVNETRAITLVQAGTPANQFASAIDRAGNITNFTESCAGKSFSFSEDSKETCP